VTVVEKQAAAATATTASTPVVETQASVAEQPAASTPKPKLKLGNIGFTFNNLRNQKEQPQQNAVSDIAKKSVDNNQTFTQEELELHWMSMCNRMPQEMSGMASRMKNMIPQITDFPNIELLVDNQVLQNQIEKIKPRISATLIKELHNNQIKIEINLAQTEEIAPIKSKKDLFEDMRKNNPAIEQLRQILQLDLA